MALAAFGAIVAAYAFWRLPDNTVPQPTLSNVEIDFEPGHSARSPITVDLRLWQDLNARGQLGAALAIDLTGEDFAHAGWSVVAVVPTGVRMNDPRTGQVSRLSDAEDIVRVAPGSAPQGKYTAFLLWDDLDSGPMQEQGANLVASFPMVTVHNQTSADDEEEFAPPRPQVTVRRQLLPSGDYAFLAGVPPDRLVTGAWYWNPETGHVSEGIVAYPLDVAARSATADEQSHAAEFQSGIAFGIAAAALLAATQEFLNSASRNR